MFPAQAGANELKSSPQNELDRVVINSIRSAQNISQSFSYCIQLCDSDSDSSTDLGAATLPARIDSFIKRIGRYVFPQAELTDLVTRCYYAYQHLGASLNGEERCNGRSQAECTDLDECIEYVQKNLEHIHSVHERCPIPMFRPFTDDEAQFLSDLNMYIHSSHC
ncbi:unnamed protein product [Gongylonema pulchrum]|uniref:Type VI secretion system protein n=1 Tax=Gongylonema pulchrum TaxID=637853 RepID=A0A183EFE8_9BILA|nr:unnamed protein product [Gongylonema pulchrum]